MNGINSNLGTIKTTVGILESTSGASLFSARGTFFPNAEIWQYGGPDGPNLLLDFQTPYSEPINGLEFTGNLVTGQEDAVEYPVLYP